MEEQKIDINIPESVAGGVYSNMVVITHSDSEFVLDFVQNAPGVKGVVRSRVIMAPDQAKRFLYALNQNINLFEKSFGGIALHEPVTVVPSAKA